MERVKVLGYEKEDLELLPLGTVVNFTCKVPDDLGGGVGLPAKKNCGTSKSEQCSLRAECREGSVWHPDVQNYCQGLSNSAP